MASADAARAFRAIGILSKAPQQAVPLLQKRLKPAAEIDPKQIKRIEQRIAKLVADLDSDRFIVRQVLEKLAKGVPRAKLTREAKAALNRLSVRIPSRNEGGNH